MPSSWSVAARSACFGTLGFRRAALVAMVLYEAGILGIFGALYGTAVGVLLSLVLIFVIDRQAFGWLVTLQIPWATCSQALALVVVAALLGGLYPARVAARIRTDAGGAQRMSLSGYARAKSSGGSARPAAPHSLL